MNSQNTQEPKKTKTTVLVSGYTWPMQKAVGQFQEGKEPLLCVSCLDPGSEETIGTVVGMAEGGDSWLVEIEHEEDEAAFIASAGFLFINDSNDKVFLVQMTGERREDLRKLVGLYKETILSTKHLEHDRGDPRPVTQTSSKNELGISVCAGDIGRGLTDEARMKQFQEQNPELFQNGVVMEDFRKAFDEQGSDLLKGGDLDTGSLEKPESRSSSKELLKKPLSASEYFNNKRDGVVKTKGHE